MERGGRMNRHRLVRGDRVSCGINRQFLVQYFAAHVDATEQYVRRMRESDAKF